MDDYLIGYASPDGFVFIELVRERSLDGALEAFVGGITTSVPIWITLAPQQDRGVEALLAIEPTAVPQYRLAGELEA